MNVLSLFDGMSCGQIALRESNIKVDNYFASEIENNAIKVTNCNFPNTIQLGDVLEINIELLPKIDLLIGGSPCQSLSQTVSYNTGFSGKSKLFFEYVKILNKIRPKYFLLENVKMKKEWEDIITKELKVPPVEINSSEYSPQSRSRLYWTNIPLAEKSPKDTRVLKDILEPMVAGKYFYNEPFEYLGDKAVCATLRINGHDIIKRVNSPNYKCQTLTAVCGGNQQRKVLIGDRVRKLTPKEYERLQGIPDNYSAIASDGARYKMIGNAWTVPVIKYIFKELKKEQGGE